MAILIPDMQIPDRCGNCEWNRQNKGSWVCVIVPFPNRWRPTQAEQSRPDWCPLVEIQKTKSPLTDKELEEAGFEL